MAYWSNDTGGWQYLPEEHHPAHPPLLDPSDARANVGGYDDYPELYTRWFQYATFLPIFRAHGSRPANEVWSYGKQAEPILEKYLRLRYQLMPYIYSLGYQTWLTGAPYMRALPHGLPQRSKGRRPARRVHVRPGLSGGAGHRPGRDQPRGLSAGRNRLVQLLDQRAREGRPDDHRRGAHRHHSAVRPGRLDRSAGSAG